ncbi:hypothetical protein GM418_27050 [Maribellus comscasis]|uniref:Uncharacterized protein n=1 Tax=Maribellus comscasis TaxID=2681766 RepID=A0A6I6K0R8_9BACT|nr:hypothetical protein [Maribellus comscasis]QGY47189.1 hypothetical protein GM418_27050 [Maribellus comscasis]
MKKIFVILFVLFHAFCYSRNSRILPFSSGDRVCFVENSITHDGRFFHNAMLYHIIRFPDRQVTFFNRGIAGDVTSGVIKRMDHILVNKPLENDIKKNMISLQEEAFRKAQPVEHEYLRKPVNKKRGQILKA